MYIRLKMILHSLIQSLSFFIYLSGFSGRGSFGIIFFFSLSHFSSSLPSSTFQLPQDCIFLRHLYRSIYDLFISLLILFFSAPSQFRYVDYHSKKKILVTQMIFFLLRFLIATERRKKLNIPNRNH